MSFELEKRSRSNSTSFPENVFSVSACKFNEQKASDQDFSVTETRVHSFGSRPPVFGDLILLVKFIFFPVALEPPIASPDSELFFPLPCILREQPSCLSI